MNRSFSTDDLLERVARTLAEGECYHQSLPLGGELRVDGFVPLLLFSRPPQEKLKQIGVQALIRGEASFLFFPGDTSWGVRLLEGLVKLLLERLPELAVVEVVQSSATDRGRASHGHEALKMKEDFPWTLDSLALEPQDLDLAQPSVYLRFELPVDFLDPETRQVYPLLLKSRLHQCSRAIREVVWGQLTSHCAANFPTPRSLGTRSVPTSVWSIDKQLDSVSGAYDFLLEITPVNTLEAWRGFRDAGFRGTPNFRYRPLRVDPERLKLQLYESAATSVDDPVFSRLFEDKRAELDAQITMLRLRGSPDFLHASLLLFKEVDDRLRALAEALLNSLPAEPADSEAPWTATRFARRAERELESYREQDPALKSRVQVGDFPGLMVSKGNLLVGRELMISPKRVKALVAHEVGTHIITYHNGVSQPLRQLYSGLSGYDEFQEGLAVLAEFLVGGLNNDRLRLLAARVIAVRMLTEEASFEDVFHNLRRRHGFAPETAFGITTRVFRGGGLTKDAVYLRGLQSILSYIASGRPVEPLFIGKLTPHHIPDLEELQERQILTAPRLLPHYLKEHKARRRLALLRKGVSILALTGLEQHPA